MSHISERKTKLNSTDLLSGFKSDFFFSHLAIILVHTVGNIQDPVHLYIVWIKRLLILNKTTESEAVEICTTMWGVTLCIFFLNHSVQDVWFSMKHKFGPPCDSNVKIAYLCVLLDTLVHKLAH